MARSKRGGYQPPSKPAAVSGPGALSRRTDGGPSVEYKGLPYGDNKAVNDMAAAAPMGGGSGGGAPVPQGGGGGPVPGGPGDVFSQTRRPDEPLTEGVDFGPGGGAPQPMLEDDPYLYLRVLAERFPNPDLDRLVARLSRG